MNKNALLIGAAGGVGLAVCDHLGRNGWEIYATYHNKLLENKNGIRAYQLDITDEAAVQHTMKNIFDSAGHVDAIVYMPSSAVKTQPLEAKIWNDFQRHIDVQLKGLFTVVKSALPIIKKQSRTKIVVLLTECCFGQPPNGMADYVSAKYALEGFSKSLAVELARYNCTVNMVSPGVMKTPLTAMLPDKLFELLAMQNPLKKLATPDDVAGVVEFLISDAADYLNGVNIPVNGGGVM